MALFNQSHIQQKSYLHILKDSEGLLLSWLHLALFLFFFPTVTFESRIHSNMCFYKNKN